MTRPIAYIFHLFFIHFIYLLIWGGQGPRARALAQKSARTVGRSDGRTGALFWARARALGPWPPPNEQIHEIN